MPESQGRFVWYELMTTDMAGAKAFYSDVVGWGTQDADMPDVPYAMFIAGGKHVGGLMNQPEKVKAAGAPPNWTGYIAVDDVDAATDKVKRLGGTVHMPPSDIPNVGRFSVVADPQMAAFILFKSSNPSQDQPADPFAPGRTGWHELYTSDWEKALDFYSEMFGWQKDQAIDMGPELGTYQLFALDGQQIGGMFNKPADIPATFWLYYFNVDDINAAAERVKAGSGKVIMGPMEVPGGSWIIQCSDPQGAMFALTKQAQPAAAA